MGNNMVTINTSELEDLIYNNALLDVVKRVWNSDKIRSYQKDELFAELLGEGTDDSEDETKEKMWVTVK